MDLALFLMFNKCMSKNFIFQTRVFNLSGKLSMEVMEKYKISTQYLINYLQHAGSNHITLTLYSPSRILRFCARGIFRRIW